MTLRAHADRRRRARLVLRQPGPRRSPGPYHRPQQRWPRAGQLLRLKFRLLCDGPFNQEISWCSTCVTPSPVMHLNTRHAHRRAGRRSGGDRPLLLEPLENRHPALRDLPSRPVPAAASHQRNHPQRQHLRHRAAGHHQPYRPGQHRGQHPELAPGLHQRGRQLHDGPQLPASDRPFVRRRHRHGLRLHRPPVLGQPSGLRRQPGRRRGHRGQPHHRGADRQHRAHPQPRRRPRRQGVPRRRRQPEQPQPRQPLRVLRGVHLRGQPVRDVFLALHRPWPNLVDAHASLHPRGAERRGLDLAVERHRGHWRPRLRRVPLAAPVQRQ